MTTQTIEQAVEEFKAKQTLIEPDGFLADVGEDYEAVDFNMEVMEVWLREALQAQRTALLTELRESGLLEEKDDPDVIATEDIYRESGHNTLARAIKAHLDELINPTH